MGKIKFGFLCFLFLLFNSGLGFTATTATSNVTLTSMSFSTDGTLTIDYDLEGWLGESSSQIYAKDSDELMDWTEHDENDFAYTSVSANFTHAQASAQSQATGTGTGTPYSLEAHGHSELGPGNQEANTEAWSYFWFAVKGGDSGGSITINAHYEMDISLEADQNTSAYAYADVQMGGDIWPETGGYDWDEVEFLEHTLVGSGSFGDTKGGNLKVTMYFGPDVAGEFWWEVESYTTTVPIPSTISLLSLGLFGLAGFKRRQK